MTEECPKTGPPSAWTNWLQNHDILNKDSERAAVTSHNLHVCAQWPESFDSNCDSDMNGIVRGEPLHENMPTKRPSKRKLVSISKLSGNKRPILCFDSYETPIPCGS